MHPNSIGVGDGDEFLMRLLLTLLLTLTLSAHAAVLYQYADTVTIESVEGTRTGIVTVDGHSVTLDADGAARLYKAAVRLAAVVHRFELRPARADQTATVTTYGAVRLAAEQVGADAVLRISVEGDGETFAGVGIDELVSGCYQLKEWTAREELGAAAPAMGRWF